MLEIYAITLICLVLTNFWFCIKKVKRKGVFLILDIVSIGILILIMSQSLYSDLVAYERHYTFSASDMLDARFEAGFNWYMVICKYYLGLSFYQFKLVTYTICTFLLYVTYRKFTYNFSYFVMLFMMYEIFFDGLQMRNYIAICLIVFGLPYLMSGTIKGFIVFIITAVLGFFFHASSIALWIFGLIGIGLKSGYRIKNGKQLIEYTILFIVLVAICLARMGILSSIISSIALAYVNVDTSKRILSHSSMALGGSQIYLTALTFTYVFFVTFIFRKERGNVFTNSYKRLSIHKLKIRTIEQEVRMDYGYIRKFEYLNYLSLFFLALCFIGTTFYRLLRDICLIDIMFFGIIINNSKSKNMRLLVYVVSIILVSGWVFYDLIVPGRFFTHIIGYLK